MRTSTGFTAIEMLVTVSVIGIVSGAAITNLSPLIRTQQLKQATNQLTGILRQTRTLAIAKNTVLTLKLIPGNAPSYCITTATDCTSGVIISDSLASTINLGLTTNPDFSSVTFNARGIVTSPTITATNIPTATLSYATDTNVATRQIRLLSILGKVGVQ